MDLGHIICVSFIPISFIHVLQKEILADFTTKLLVKKQTRCLLATYTMMPVLESPCNGKFNDSLGLNRILNPREDLRIPTSSSLSSNIRMENYLSKDNQVPICLLWTARVKSKRQQSSKPPHHDSKQGGRTLKTVDAPFQQEVATENDVCPISQKISGSQPLEGECKRRRQSDMSRHKGAVSTLERTPRNISLDAQYSIFKLSECC
uniref:DUF3496 domain-containing protein n=1 Tax=Callithrix jacchus TaxID=9483 RepID=A0A8I3WVX1_CALJA